MEHTAEALMETLYRLSGMTVTLYDSEFHCVSGFPRERSGPHFCSLLHRAMGSIDVCLAADARARRECLRTGTVYSYRCPFGLFEAIVPIRSGSLIVGYLLMGKSLPAAHGEERLREALCEMGLSASAFSEAIEALPRHTDEQYEAFCQTLTVFAEYLAGRERLHVGGGDLAQMVHRYLRRHYPERITLSELSLHFHCSTVTLTEAYRKTYQTTILQALYEIRLEHAKQMLAQTDASVSEIALCNGFPDVGSFFKRFRKEIGMTPTEWRTQASGDIVADATQKNNDKSIK